MKSDTNYADVGIASQLFDYRFIQLLFLTVYLFYSFYRRLTSSYRQSVRKTTLVMIWYCSVIILTETN